jgi:hypothetical protein
MPRPPLRNINVAQECGKIAGDVRRTRNRAALLPRPAPPAGNALQLPGMPPGTPFVVEYSKCSA